MTNENSTLSHLIDELVLYHLSTGLAICRPCGSAFPNNIERHLRDFHGGLSFPERRALVSYIESLSGRRSIEQITTEYSIDTEVDAIEGLPIITGCKCNHCGFLGAPSSMKTHRKEHNWTRGQGNINLYYS